MHLGNHIRDFFENFLPFLKKHPGIALVIIGVAGEIALEWKKENGRRGHFLRFFGVLLLCGLLWEIFESIATDNQIKEVNPLNQPISDLRATGWFVVKGSNNLSFDPGTQFCCVYFGNTNKEHGYGALHSFPARPILCVEEKHRIVSDPYYHTFETVWILEFRTADQWTFWDSHKLKAGVLLDWKDAAIEENFIPGPIDVKGTITVTANSTVSSFFIISNQSPATVYGDKLQIVGSRFENR